MDPEWGVQGVRTPPPPLKNLNNLWLLSNTGPDTLKITVNSMLDHHRHASEMSFKLRFADGPMVARLY